MTTSRRTFLQSLALGSGLLAASKPRPNIIFILTDDMGWGDLGCYGGKFAKTPKLDHFASQGIRFKQFYVASPICSPSRTGLTTGMFPARWRINDYLHQRAANRAHEQADFLDPKAPSLARALKQAGYAAAGHFGKWHMGGGRDVQDAPEPSAYGFDESLTTFEGMGPRVDEKTPRYRLTETFVDRALDFVRRNKTRPFYLNLWPQDVHTPHLPDPEILKRYTAGPKDERNFSAVLDEYDHQIGRFLDEIHGMGLDDNSLVVFSSDNGPQPSFRHERSGGLRGMKWSLYEGGVREPFMVRWPGRIPAGKVDETSVVSGVDLFPSVCKIAGAPLPNAEFDGVDMSAAMLGKPRERKRPLLWEYGRQPDYLYPDQEYDKSPNVAVREGKWKLLVNADATRTELYDAIADPKETKNLAESEPSVTRRLRENALRWRRSLP